jgi:ribosome-binding factor A
MRLVPTLTFIHDALPESARALDEVLAKARESDQQVAAVREGATYAGDVDPYKKPREEPVDETATGELDEPAAPDEK